MQTRSHNEIWPVYVILSHISKIFANTATWQLVPGPFVFAKNKAKHLLENEIFEASYLHWICIKKLSKFFQICMQTTSDSFLHGIPWKTKEPGTSFQATFFVEFFGKKFSFVILHELAKFNYQALFSFSSYLVKCVLCFMLRHDTWTSSSPEMIYNIIFSISSKAMCSWSFIHSHFWCKNLNAVCAD